LFCLSFYFICYNVKCEIDRNNNVTGKLDLTSFQMSRYFIKQLRWCFMQKTLRRRSSILSQKIRWISCGKAKY